MTIKKTSFNPTSRRSSHALAGDPGRAPAISGAYGQVTQVFGTHNEKAEYSANQLLDGLEEHPASQSSPPPGRR
jgi:hypothetical protein